MPKALIVVTVLVFLLGIWLVKGQMSDFDRFSRQREGIVDHQQRNQPEPGVELHGRLADASGRPLVGLTVELAAAEEAAFLAVAFALTDEKGRFSFQVDSPRPRSIRVASPSGRSRIYPSLSPSAALELVFDPEPVEETR